jgi:hypothetical protein
MNIKDRGLMKWHGFFMPEHTGTLKKMHQEDSKIKIPILDEYQLEEFEERINSAVEYHLPVEFKIFVDGFEDKITGFVHHIDQIKRQFNVEDLSDQVSYVKFENIMDVKIIE